MALWYKIFKEFSNHLSIFIIYGKVDPHSELLKRTKNVFIFFKYFTPPPKYLNLQQSKSRQNGLKILYIDCTEVGALTYTFFHLRDRYMGLKR